MKECLDDIRTELQTLKDCIGRLSEQIDRLERQMEDAEKHPVPASMPETSASETPALSPRRIDRVNVQTSAGFRHELSLNDSFRFTRELFEGDAARLGRMLDALDEVETLEGAIDLFKSEVPLPEENEAVAEFMEILRKHFNAK